MKEYHEICDPLLHFHISCGFEQDHLINSGGGPTTAQGAREYCGLGVCYNRSQKEPRVPMLRTLS